MYSKFIIANGPNVFNKRILKRLRKAYKICYWKVNPSDIYAVIYHDAFNRPVAWYNPEMKWGFFPE